MTFSFRVFLSLALNQFDQFYNKNNVVTLTTKRQSCGTRVGQASLFSPAKIKFQQDLKIEMLKQQWNTETSFEDLNFIKMPLRIALNNSYSLRDAETPRNTKSLSSWRSTQYYPYLNNRMSLRFVLYYLFKRYKLFQRL